MSVKDEASREARADRFLGEAQEPLVANAADATQVKAGRKSAKRQRIIQLEDLRAILDLPSGRRLVWRILEQCGTFKSTAASDVAIMAYNAGRQDIGHFLLSEITHAQPDVLPSLMSEAYKEISS